jgi:DNA-binding NtrC family response regulator
VTVTSKFEVDLEEQPPPTLKEVEKRYIETVLERCGGNKSKAFKVLGIGRTTLYRKLGMRKD